ncbi:LytR C-terminal domain-containing protein [Nocardioides flavescens]|uniref:LytR C-terminal domain-containing protein n=1 Tax=Nocardioides flavescens TaxID=2691959 RepID=UPI00301BA3F7
MEFWDGLNARLRTLITLGALAVLLLGGVLWGFAQVTAPFPGKAEAPLCVDTSYAAGETLYPQDVTVSVLNASRREGLAGRTMQQFVDAGFAQGQISNAPEGTDVAAVEIWTDEPQDPAARLVRSRLGPVPVRADDRSPVVGVTIVVGDGFTELSDGKASIALTAPTTVCSPPVG